MEVTSGPHCQEGSISLYLDTEFYELNLSIFNGIFGFSLSMNLPYRHVPKEFNLNAFWHEIFWGYRYDTSNPKCIVIRNPCILLAQRLLACGLFARTIASMCFTYLNCVCCIACSKVTDLTPIHSWIISYIVRPLVSYRGL